MKNTHIFTLAVALLAALALLAHTPSTGTAENTLTAGTGFTIRDDGLIIDQERGLMWAPRDNGEDVNWFGAVEYCDNYNKGGYTDWRLPTARELSTIIDPDKANAAGVHVRPFLTLSDFFLWTSEEHACKATCVNFLTKGLNKFSKARVGVARALPVRTIHP